MEYDVKSKSKAYFESVRGGFGGLTHVLIAVAVFLLILDAPLDIISDFVEFVNEDWLFLACAFLVVVGASLLPDLDNDYSTATLQLGLFGAVVKTFMQTVSYAFYSVTRLKKDDPRPKSMHRKLFHAPAFGVGLICFAYFGLEPSESSYVDYLVSNKDDLFYALTSDVAPLVCLVLIYVSAWLGVNNLTYWPFRLLKLNSLRRYKQSLFVLVAGGVTYFSATLPLSDLRYMGIAVGLGYLIHILADAFTEGSVPVIYPIPAFWAGKWWWNPYILGPFQIYTGGVVNKVIDIALLALNIYLTLNAFLS